MRKKNVDVLVLSMLSDAASVSEFATPSATYQLTEALGARLLVQRGYRYTYASFLT